MYSAWQQTSAIEASMAVEACMLLLVHLIVNPITKKIH
jgi:hypothetical protein